MKNQNDQINIFFLIITFLEYYKIKRGFKYRIIFKDKHNFIVRFKNVSNFYIHFNFDVQCNLVIENSNKTNHDIFCSFDIFIKNDGLIFYDPYLKPIINYKSIYSLLENEMFNPLEAWLDTNLEHNSAGRIELLKLNRKIVGCEGKLVSQNNHMASFKKEIN